MAKKKKKKICVILAKVIRAEGSRVLFKSKCVMCLFNNSGFLPFGFSAKDVEQNFGIRVSVLFKCRATSSSNGRYLGNSENRLRSSLD